MTTTASTTPGVTPTWNMVLLRHDVPDGTWHYDWMLDLGHAGGLVTFRVWERPELVAVGGVGGSVRGQRLGLHRRDYLVYEGEVSGGRGRVARVITGRAAAIGEEVVGAGVLEFEAAFEGGATGRWRAREAGAAWEITLVG